MKRRKDQPEGVFAEIAKKHGITVDEVVKEMRIAIDAAWDNPDPAIRATQRRHFPNGKPTVEEYLRVIVGRVKDELEDD